MEAVVPRLRNRHSRARGGGVQRAVSVGFPLLLSLRVAFAALAAIVPIGLVLGYLQARRDYPGRALVDVLIVLPIVLPPSVTGYYLILLLGRNGVIGGPLYEILGVSIIFTFWAAVIAAVVVALPLFIKFAQAAFHGVDPELEAVARTLGAGPISAGWWRGFYVGGARGGQVTEESNSCHSRSLGAGQGPLR